MRTRTLAGLSCVLLLAVACGGTKSATGEAKEQLIAAQENTLAAGSARAALTMSFESEETPDLSFTMKGVLDLQNDTGGFSADLSELVPGRDGSMDIIFVKDVVYFKAPGFLSGTDPDKPWLKSTLSQFTGQAPAAPGFGQDPSQSLLYLSGVTEARETGAEDIRGEPTTRYEGLIDVAELVAGAPEDKQATSAEYFQRLGLDTLPFQAWIDGEGKMRKLTMTIVTTGALDAPVQDTSFVFTVEMWDFGTPVDISPPPADRVQELEGKSGG